MRLIDADAVSAILEWLITERTEEHRNGEAIGLAKAKMEVDTMPTYPQCRPWISVEDDLPTAGHAVLALLPSDLIVITYVFWFGDHPHWGAGADCYLPVKYWMPLPDTPDD